MTCECHINRPFARRLEELQLEVARASCRQSLKELVLHVHRCPKLTKVAKHLGSLEVQVWSAWCVGGHVQVTSQHGFGCQ